MTGLTAAAFMALLPYFEHALVAYMQDRPIDGQPRTSRRYSTDDTCPVPTMADKLLFILTSVQQHPIQAVQGQLLGRSPSHANTWIHRLHPVLHQAVADQERLPARTADALAVRLAQQPPEDPSTAPLVGMMGPNARSSAQKIPRSSKSITVARRRVTRAKTSS